MLPTEKQIDFATRIAETLGIDLPDEKTSTAYSRFIGENMDEFYEVQDEIRYSSGRIFKLEHSYTLTDGFCGDTKLNINPET